MGHTHNGSSGPFKTDMLADPTYSIAKFESLWFLTFQFITVISFPHITHGGVGDTFNICAHLTSNTFGLLSLSADSSFTRLLYSTETSFRQKYKIYKSIFPFSIICYLTIDG